MIATEHKEQSEFVWWLRREHPTIKIFSIPNGGQRSRKEGLKMKLEGASPGVPDLFVPCLKLFIEMKAVKRGRVSKEQKDWMSYLTGCGNRCIVCHGAEEAKTKIEEIIHEHGL